jgi:endonuclease-3
VILQSEWKCFSGTFKLLWLKVLVEEVRKHAVQQQSPITEGVIGQHSQITEGKDYEREREITINQRDPEVINDLMYISLKSFVERNTLSTSNTQRDYQGAMFSWFARYGGYFILKGNKECVNVHEHHLCCLLFKLLEKTLSLDIRLKKSTKNNGLMTKRPTVPSKTRSAQAKTAKYLLTASKAQQVINYSDGFRHIPGAFPKITERPRRNFNFVPPDTGDVEQRMLTLTMLESLHKRVLKAGVAAPRDDWQDWMLSFKDEQGSDYAFMCLVTILMSSSTSDHQLSEVMPCLFSAGLTSSFGVLEIVENYGMDCFCSLLSQTGRFYQNAERVVNAADYFVKFHKGHIPRNISIDELCSLLGVGYKTANIVVSTAFGRVEGIPSDIHVIRWVYILGWIPNLLDGYRCSKMLEHWIPKQNWACANPLFGAMGQLLSMHETRALLLKFVDDLRNPLISKIFNNACTIYKV